MSVPVYQLSKLPDVLMFTLRDGTQVFVGKDEVEEFVTEILTPNPYWRFSGLLVEAEVIQFLNNEANVLTLERVALYVLVYVENMAFSAWLIIKQREGEERAEDYKEFVMPVIKKLREMYLDIKENGVTEEKVWAMMREALKAGFDPL